ncbi:glycosyl transferase family 2 [Halocatena marina]|uniref:glycosyl transferase family 2 n=1 Tax=Halocatena marina TaxID=2934937 RepID=UPI00200BA606|nr:glycosyl transferase family 2 [Halocatena marina]
MEYVQERVTTLHDFADTVPDAPTDRTSVVVPMTEHAHASHTTERILTTLERVDPARVVVALRADEQNVSKIHEWLSSYEFACETVWCGGPRVQERLRKAGLDGPHGKGRDVWLAIGVASDNEYIVFHDADTETYSERHINRLLFPLARDYSFVKGYYARIEENQLYGRLFRLFYVPIVRALAERQSAPVVEYLAAFRYALAGEMAMTTALARQLRLPRGWGLEVGVLGNAFEHAGFAGSAQTDLGVHEHDHRAVGGPQGLGGMSVEVGAALFHALADNGVHPDYELLRERYHKTATTLINQYAEDAAFNGLDYDSTAEHGQIKEYAKAVQPPKKDTRLPAWENAPIDPHAVSNAARLDMNEQI